MKKLGGIFLAVLTFFSSTLNVFADAVEVYEEKTQTINKDDYESYKEDVEKKVYELNESDDEYVYDYTIEITKEEDEIVITDTKKVTSEMKFTSEEAAKKFYEEYELEDSWKQGELTITSKDEDVVVNGNEITITCTEATCASEIAALEATLNEFEDLEVVKKETTSTDDKKTVVYSIDGVEQELEFEDAVEVLNNLKPAIEDYTITKKEMILSKKGSIEAKDFKDVMGTDKFETYEEAKQAVDKFMSDENYENQVATIVAVYDETEKTTNTESIIALTEELAYTMAIADIKEEIETAIEEGRLTIESTIEETKAALEEALRTGKLELNGMKLDGRIVYYNLPEQRTEKTEETITNTFYTETAANLAKEAVEKMAAELEEKGEVEGVKGYIENITLVEDKDSTIVSDATTIRKVAGKYIFVPAEGTYYSLRKDNKIVIWTVSELDATKKDEITKTLQESDESIESVTFTTGYNVEKELAGIKYTFKKASKWGLTTYTIEISDDSNVKVEGGIVTAGKTYKLSYTMVAETNFWYVDKTEITYGFDYNVEGGGATVTRDLFKVQSELMGKIYNHTMAYRVNTTSSYTSYVASFDIYKEETKTNATVAYKITREKAATGSTEEDITPPNTGVETNFAFQSLAILAILAAAISLKKLCK